MATFGFSAGTYARIGPGLYNVDIQQGFSVSRFATATDKLVFQVFYCIMTPLGSIPSDPTFGTLIPAAIGRFSVNSATDLQQFILNEYLRAQACTVSRQLNQGLPPDQVLQRLTAESIQVDQATASASIITSIVNQSNQTIGFSIPVTIGAL